METILGKYLNCIADYVESGGVQERIKDGVLEAGFEFNKRVFNSNVGTKDITYSKLVSGRSTAYSNPYAKFRQENKRQTAFKDFELEGDLRRAIFQGGKAKQINTRQEGNTLIVEIDNSVSSPKARTKKDGSKGKAPKKISNRQKATYLQDYQKGKGNENIFEYTLQEVNKIYEIADKGLIKDFKNIANECTGIS